MTTWRSKRSTTPATPSPGCPVVEQLQGGLDAAGEELIGNVAIAQRSGKLEGADHHRDEHQRVGPGRVGVCRVQARRDVVCDAEQLVGEDLSGGGGAAADLVEQ